MDKQILYDLIKSNPCVEAREALAKYVDNTEFTLSKVGGFTFAIDNNNPKIRLHIPNQ